MPFISHDKEKLAGIIAKEWSEKTKKINIIESNSKSIINIDDTTDIRSCSNINSNSA